MLKIRRPLGRLIFNMGIATPGKTVFLIETAPRRQGVMVIFHFMWCLICILVVGRWPVSMPFDYALSTCFVSIKVSIVDQILFRNKERLEAIHSKSFCDAFVGNPGVHFCHQQFPGVNSVVSTNYNLSDNFGQKMSSFTVIPYSRYGVDHLATETRVDVVENYFLLGADSQQFARGVTRTLRTFIIAPTTWRWNPRRRQRQNMSRIRQQHTIDQLTLYLNTPRHWYR